MPFTFSPIDLHPAIVHFPIALLLTAVALDVIAAILRKPGVTDAATWCMGFGTFGALVAGFTGNISEHAIARANVGPTLNLHSHVAFATGAVFAMLFAIRLILTAPRILATYKGVGIVSQLDRSLRGTLPGLYRAELPRGLSWLYFAGELIDVALLAYTGYLGGLMVYHLHAIS